MSSFRIQLQEKITAQGIQKLEQGVSPWHCPLIKTGSGGLPINGKTKLRYNSVNIFILWNEMDKHQWSGNQWLAFKQALEMDFKVGKGSKSGREWTAGRMEGQQPRFIEVLVCFGLTGGCSRWFIIGLQRCDPQLKRTIVIQAGN